MEVDILRRVTFPIKCGNLKIIFQIQVYIFTDGAN